VEQLELEKIEYKIFREVEPLLSTTSLARVRGFTVDLLFCLKDMPKRCCELVVITGKPHFYIWRYLKNMQNYGLVSKNGVFWELTDLGVYFADYLEEVYSKISEYRKKVERKCKERRKKEERCNRKSEDLLCAETPYRKCRRKSRQIQIEPFLRNCNLDDLEKAVVEVLITHYNKTGSKFIMVKDQYELAEKLSCNPSDLPNALKNLRQDGIIYIFKDKTFGYWKIGLKKQFLERLKIKSEKT